MNKKHQIILSALMLGIGSGWAALNQNIFANEDNVVPEVIENEESGNAIQENGESTPAAESEEEMLSAKKESEEEIDSSLSQSDFQVNQGNEEDKKKENFQTIQDNEENENEQEDQKDLDSSVKLEETQEKGFDTLETVKEEAAPMKMTLSRQNAPKANLNGWVGNKYYVNNEISKGEVLIGGDTHLFNNDGNPLTGFMYYNNRYIYCDSQGKVLKGTHQVGNMSFTADQTGNIYATSLNNVPYYNQTDGRWGNLTYNGKSMSSTGALS